MHVTARVGRLGDDLLGLPPSERRRRDPDEERVDGKGLERGGGRQGGGREGERRRETEMELKG